MRKNVKNVSKFSSSAACDGNIHGSIIWYTKEANIFL